MMWPFSPRMMVVFLIAVGFSSLLLAGTGTEAQEQDRIVKKLRRRPMPVEIKVVRTKKGEVGIDRNFTDDDDWFRGLAVSVENTSGKTIIYMSGGFLFPRPLAPGVDQPAPGYHRFMYGRHPQAPEEARLTNQPINVKPGETFTITLIETDYDSIKQKLKKLGYPAGIKEINVNIEEIYFDDGTAWIAGGWYRRDPSAPINMIEWTSPKALSK